MSRLIKSNSTNDTKQKLIDTAMELIWKSSYGSVSVDDICRTADVKKGSFYHYFPSKVDLALAAMDEFYQILKPEYDAIFSADVAPVQRFEKLADFVYEGQAEIARQYGMVCGCPFASLGSEMACQDNKIRGKFDEITNRKNRYYENALRDMIADGLLPETTDVKVKSQEIFAYFIGQMTMARIQNDLEHLKRDLRVGLFRTIGIDAKIPAAA